VHKYALFLAIAVLALGARASTSTSTSVSGNLAVVASPPYESGGVHHPSDVYVVDASGRNVRNITHDGASNGLVSWTHDGRRIVFQSQPSDPKRGTPHIFVVGADGNGRRRLTSKLGGMCPEVSPDGRMIVFIVHRPRKQGLYVMNVNGTHQRRLTDRKVGLVGFCPSWSPDSRKILFIDEAHADLFVIRADGTEVKRLTQDGGLWASWSPDGRKIGLLRAPGAQALALYVIRADGSGIKKLSPPGIATGGGRGPIWFPDSRRIVYMDSNGVVWSVTIDGRRERRQLPASPWTWSPDGRWFAFSVRGSQIELARADGSRRRTVTRRICCLLEQVEWSPR
jgi:Tol biopolymer transport system component